MKRILLLLLCSAFAIKKSRAQTGGAWHGKKCAVVLTYDDGINVDLENVIPALDSLSFKGTFYISDNQNELSKQTAGWKKAAANGHELANHTIHHPCRASLPGRTWVQPDADLDKYTVKRMVDEAKEMNAILKKIDGQTKRTFAYPCGDLTINDTPYINYLKKDFIAARGTTPEMLSIDKIDLYNIGCYGIDGPQQASKMLSLVNQAMEKGALLVFLFHGVGGGHNLNVALEEHSQLLHYLKQHEQDIWIAPFIEVASFIKGSRK